MRDIELLLRGLCTTTPLQHQIEGVERLIQDKVILLADEVGCGKSKQVVDAAQIKFIAGKIDTVLVIAPAFARSVWASPNPAMGEVAKHGWATVQNEIREYSVNHKASTKLLTDPSKLLWMVTNYEFVRREERLMPMLTFLMNRRFWLICDEGWALKDQGTVQFKAVYKIREIAEAVAILNGTPIADSPLDLNAQMKMLDPRILGFPMKNLRTGKISWSCADTRFRDRYAVMQPNSTFPKIIDWKNLEELREKVRPYVLRRKTRECFDLPEILEPVTIEARLSPETWKIYTQMRDELCAFLANGDASIARQAIVKTLRLAQITSGFLGGIHTIDPETLQIQETVHDEPPREVGREKLDAMLDWLSHIEQPARLLIWSKFRAEVERTAAAFSSTAKEPHLRRQAYMLYGLQSKADRQAAIEALNPDIEPPGPNVVVGNAQAGGAGLNLSGASMAISISEDFNLRVLLQKAGRIDRLGQRHPIQYVNVLATGPKGQKTIDHHIVAALRGKDDVAKWTSATWRTKLMEE